MREAAGRISAVLNRAVEAVVVILMAALVLDVWIGVLDRYLFRWQLPWPEILARYLMIWTVLLAISCAIARREHIGLTLVVDRLPPSLRRLALMTSDVLAMILFAYVVWYGVSFAAGGVDRKMMIFGLSMAPAFSALPVAGALAALQLGLVLVRDGGVYALPDQANEA